MLKECPKSYKACTNEMNLRKEELVHCKQKIEKYKEVRDSKDQKMRRNKLHKTK